MYRKIILMAAVVLFMSGLFFSAKAQSDAGLFSNLGIEVSGDASVYSQYVWRGFILDRDAVIQPSIYVAGPKTKFGKVKVGVWSSQPLQNNDNLSSEEFDYIFDYTYDLENVRFLDTVSLSVGHTYYDFVGTHTFSREFYVGVSLPKLLLAPSLYYYRDYGNQNHGGGLGNYILLSVAYSLPIKNTPFSLDFSGRVGFNHNLFMSGDGGDVGLKIALNAPLTKNLIFSPNVNYSIPFADLADKDKGNQKRRFFGGATITYKF